MATNGIYTIIIGETGSGKSTFINYLANFFKRGNLDNLHIAIPTQFHKANMNLVHREKALGDVTKSKTTECHCYSFPLERIDFHFIDTPGISDTGGLLQDSKNVDKIFTYVQELPYINAIILIMNGAVSRATINIQNVLTKFKERLPDAVYNNMLVILTNCQSHTVNFHPRDLGLSDKCSEFYMQNSAFSSDPTGWSSHAKNYMMNEFQKSMGTINTILETLCKLEPQSIKAFKSMDDDRNVIKRELHDARLMLMDMQKMEDELVAFEVSSGIHAFNAEKFRDFTRSKPMRIMERITTSYHNTTCSVCNAVCHENCSLNEIPVIGHTSFSNCWAMKHGHCSVCPGRCSATKHYHDRTILQPMTYNIQEVVVSLEQRYKEAKAGKEKAEIKCNDLQKMKKIIESEIQNQYLKIKDSVQRLRQTCTSFNVAAELFDFIDCLKKEAQTLKSQSVIKKVLDFVSMIERLSNEMESTTTSQSINSQLSPPRPPPQLPPIVWHNATEKSPAKHNDPDTKKIKATESVDQKQENVSAFQPVNEVLPITQQQEVSPEPKNESDIQDEFFPAESNPARDNDVDDQGSQREQNNKRRITAEGRAKPKADTEEPIYNSYTLGALIEASKICKDKAIARELRLRTLGKSIGLLTKADQFDLCEQFANHRQKQLTELIRLKDNLQDVIREETDDDPFNIEQVHPSKLLQLFAINLLITHATRESSV